ncbi:MAG: hypothetical protein N3A01_06865 [Bacteroidales bacterium]|nr:hypothetical protein [Bacteroidales bacterium]
MKTSLHKILPPNGIYCYLDSDVIALNTGCNNIFYYYKPPITFARDLTTINNFSPYAVNCGCLEKFYKEKENFENLVKKIVNHKNYPSHYTVNEFRKWDRINKQLVRNPFLIIKVLIKNLLRLNFTQIEITENIKLDIKNKEWVIDSSFSYPALILYKKEIKEKTGYKFSFIYHKWHKNNEVYVDDSYSCNHLKELLNANYNINIPKKWHHWNGGVFLFDCNSYNIMEMWHNVTIEIFNDQRWKTRDQSSLIITVFRNKLQNHSVLPEEFNFIADFYNTDITATEKQGVFKKGNKLVKPSFIHIYHEWGNINWDVWKKIISEI